MREIEVKINPHAEQLAAVFQILAEATQQISNTLSEAANNLENLGDIQ